MDKDIQDFCKWRATFAFVWNILIFSVLFLNVSY